jgi:hypothetical protein
LGQGKENIKEHLKNNPDLCKELEEKIRVKLSSEPTKLTIGASTVESSDKDNEE